MVKIKRSHLITIITLVLLIGSCRVEEFPYDKSILKYRKLYVKSRIIRMNGFYSKKNLTESEIRYFFDDGYGCFFGTSKDTDSVTCYPIDVRMRFIPYFWGLYYLKNDTLIAYSIRGGRDEFQMFKSEKLIAKVLNDTTLLFFSRRNIHNEVIQIQDTFHFHECNQVPESFNILMKD